MRSGQWGGGWGEGREAMVWREDCALCAATVLTSEGHEGKVYDITGPELQTMAQMATVLSEVTGCPIKAVLVDDEAKYAIFDALGIPRRPVDDQDVSGIPWNSDDMVSFGRAIREGFLEVRSNDVEALLGRSPRSVRDLVEANLGMLRAASPA